MNSLPWSTLDTRTTNTFLFIRHPAKSVLHRVLSDSLSPCRGQCNLLTTDPSGLTPYPFIYSRAGSIIGWIITADTQTLGVANHGENSIHKKVWIYTIRIYLTALFIQANCQTLKLRVGGNSSIQPNRVNQVIDISLTGGVTNDWTSILSNLSIM